MPKLKTKSSAKKRFSLSAAGKVRKNSAYKRHNLRKRSQKMKRKARGSSEMAAVDSPRIKKFLPYG